VSFTLVGIGEVLWDLLPEGRKLGGAPANFAHHAKALGAECSLVTRIGDDELGRAILRRCDEAGFAQETIQVDDIALTGTVSVSLSSGGVPSYVIHENVAWDRLTVTAPALDAVRRADAISFGSLAQRSDNSRQSIRTLVAAAPRHALRVFDINLRQNYFSRDVIHQSLGLANVLKMNDAELPLLAQMFSVSGSIRQQMETVAQAFDLHLVALTRGSAGSLLLRAGEWSDCPSAATTVVDTIGAGDAFTAALTLGMLCQMPLSQVNSLANEVACHVCGAAGAMPPLPKRFSQQYKAASAREGAKSTDSNIDST
jgi:fructokinase